MTLLLCAERQIGDMDGEVLGAVADTLKSNLESKEDYEENGEIFL